MPLQPSISGQPVGAYKPILCVLQGHLIQKHFSGTGQFISTKAPVSESEGQGSAHEWTNPGHIG